MFGMGLTELLIIAVILAVMLTMIAVPIVLVVVLVRRRSGPRGPGPS